MQEITRKKLKIVSSLIMCVLSLFSVVSLSLAWFAVNNSTRGDGMDVVVRNETYVLGTTYHKITKTTDGKYALGTAQTELSLGKYNALDNDYSVLLKIYLDASAEEKTVRLAAETTTSYFLGDGEHPLLPPSASDNTQPDTTGRGYTNALSSIVAFAVLTPQEVAAVKGSTLAQIPTQNRLTSLIDQTTQKPQNNVNVSQDGATSLSLSDDNYNGQACKAVYVVITYDDLLVTTVFSANIGNDVMSTTDDGGESVPIPFERDFTLFVDVQ